VFLALVFVMLLAVLAIVFFVGSVFVQSYIFTQPTEGMAWRAPTAAAIMTLFFTIWCWLVVANPDAKPGAIPLTTILNFSFRSNMFAAPVPDLWAYRAEGTPPIRYVLRHYVDLGQDKTSYQNAADPTKPFTPVGVQAVEIKTATGDKLKFTKKTEDDRSWFISDDGWMLEDHSDISGNPSRANWGLLLANLLLNFVHLALWFVCLWVILRFSLGSSVLFAAILWGLMTVAILPMLLDQAALHH
jgi:hypothetical protein